MNIYNLINSKDIAAHLQKIGYEFTSPEAAWLIWQSRHLTLRQRHDAWRELLACMPDGKTDAIETNRAIPDLREYLKCLIAAQEEAIGAFYEPAPDSYFNGEIVGRGFSGWDPTAFSTFDACLAHLNSYEINADNILHYRISKFRRMQEEYKEEITVMIDRNMQICDVDTVHFQNVFASLGFDFPVPFQKGDVLVRSQAGVPTLAGHRTERKVVYLSHGPEKGKRLATFDDMNINGYFFYGLDTLSKGFETNYIDFEVVREKLVSNERVLTITSELLRGNLDIIEYAEMYHLIKAEKELAGRSALQEKLNLL